MFRIRADVSKDVNYIEVVLVNSTINERVYNIDFTSTQCTNILHQVAAHYPDCKIFKKNTCKYLYQFLEQSVSDNEISLYHMDQISHDVLCIGNRDMLVNYYNKHLLPNHNFPSTSRVVDVIDSKRVTMKVNNNIYLNFDSLEYTSDNTKTNNIYVNINLNKSSDTEHISKLCSDLISVIQNTFVH